MSLTRRVIIALLALGLAVFVTGRNLYKQGQISGRISGAEARSVVVAQKWHQTAEEHHAGRDVYWVSWGDADIHAVGHHRTNLPPERWDAIAIGDSLELTFLAGDERPYLRGGLFESSWSFDLVLLVVEVGVAIWAIVTIVLELK